MEIESNSRLSRNMFVACETGDTNKLLECLEIAEPVAEITKPPWT